MTFKFELGETVYSKDDSSRKYPMVVGKRETKDRFWKDEEGNEFNSPYNLYSDKGFGWYLENNLTR